MSSLVNDIDFYTDTQCICFCFSIFFCQNTNCMTNKWHGIFFLCIGLTRSEVHVMVLSPAFLSFWSHDYVNSNNILGERKGKEEKGVSCKLYLSSQWVFGFSQHCQCRFHSQNDNSNDWPYQIGRLIFIRNSIMTRDWSSVIIHFRINFIVVDASLKSLSFQIKRRNNYWIVNNETGHEKEERITD